MKLVKLLIVNKINVNNLIGHLNIIRYLLKFFVYTNLILAILVYVTKLLNVELQFTWGLYIYILYFIYYFLRDFVFNISERVINFIKSNIEKLIKNLQEVKTNVDGKHNQLNIKNKIIQSAKDSYFLC